MNKELAEYIQFIKKAEVIKPVNEPDGIFLGESVSFSKQEVLFQKNTVI